MKKIIILLFISLAITANAVIPGFGLNYGQNSFYIYNEYNVNPKQHKDQYFLSYFEYGLTDQQALTVQTINYPDGTYHDLALGFLQQIVTNEYCNLRAGASYVFGPGQNHFEDGMYYSALANGQLYGDFGYIAQLGITHTFGYKPIWGDALYLTYNMLDNLTAYVCMTSNLVKFDDSIDFSVGGWYVLLQDKHGIRWITWYFDIGNIIEKNDDLRISTGIDILF